MKKFRIKQRLEVFFTTEVVLWNLVCLLKNALLEFDEVPVVPGKDGDLAFRVGNLSDNAHS